MSKPKFTSTVLNSPDELMEFCENEKVCSSCKNKDQPKALILITPTDKDYTESMYFLFSVCPGCYQQLELGGENARKIHAAIWRYFNKLSGNRKLH